MPDKKKQSGYHVEGSYTAPEGKFNFPTKASYRRQAAAYLTIGAIMTAGSFVTLPTPFAAALPIFVRLAAALGFIACGVSCVFGAQGIDLRHPIYYVLNALQIITTGFLFVWFAFGDNQLAVPWKVFGGIIFGFVTFLLIIPLVLRLAFPSLWDQALEGAERETRRNRETGHRDRD